MKIDIDIEGIVARAQSELVRRLEDSVRSEAAYIAQGFFKKPWNKNPGGYVHQLIEERANAMVLTPEFEQFVDIEIKKALEKAAGNAIKLAVDHVARKVVFNRLKEEEAS